MKTIRVMLLETEKMIQFYMRSASPADVARKLMLENAYTVAMTMAVSDGVLNFDGEQIADEFFDLTNNPSREDDRAKFYGNKRSISVGDIVEVNGSQFVCAPVGWVCI